MLNSYKQTAETVLERFTFLRATVSGHRMVSKAASVVIKTSKNRKKRGPDFHAELVRDEKHIIFWRQNKSVNKLII